ncbi:MAG TPA: cysteine desulfurase family protein [Syntrophales bacterium]|jgi:cysteine desulfurase|nr:cysteine desulfurase family protein [Syntrophales bacterium]HOU78683.1 cysteine desulfurase family protein [Syntrophales bacterium]HPC33328.1 cysteine desulfurase family protein [Syntrophales bacterium]HQG35400.1 cysteine desulfurase family protein [Syntrophales bacterium]HQI35840.1 cysteine desulfurase family protein [Syntrophales bacterium]
MSRENIYLDHSATTPTDPEVLGAMMRYFAHHYGNPASGHRFGREARQAIDTAREQVASLIGATPEEIIFTGGGTESDNLALLGAAYGETGKRNHIITSAIEHYAVLNTCKHLADRGFSVTFLPVDSQGTVDPDDARRAMTEKTLLVSIMHANNEIGTVEPLAEIAFEARRRGILVHTDAVQSVGKIPVRVSELGLDLLSLTGHKFYGPKGTGALYVRHGTNLAPIMFGGHQERGFRTGTENVPGIVGLGKACELAGRDLPWQMERMMALRQTLEKLISEKIAAVRINGHPFRRLPHVLSVSFRGVAGDAVVQELDRQGVAASAGAACTSGAVHISHVLAALGIPEDYGPGTVRFSLGKGNTEEQLCSAADLLAEIVGQLRGNRATATCPSR